MLDHRRRRALYRASYRGIKEMDLIFGSYATYRLPLIDEEGLHLFERMLDLPDQTLLSWINGADDPQKDDFEPEISLLLSFARHELTLSQQD